MFLFVVDEKFEFRVPCGRMFSRTRERKISTLGDCVRLHFARNRIYFVLVAHVVLVLVHREILIVELRAIHDGRFPGGPTTRFGHFPWIPSSSSRSIGWYRRCTNGSVASIGCQEPPPGTFRSRGGTVAAGGFGGGDDDGIRGRHGCVFIIVVGGLSSSLSEGRRTIGHRGALIRREQPMPAAFGIRCRRIPVAEEWFVAGGRSGSDHVRCGFGRIIRLVVVVVWRDSSGDGAAAARCCCCCCCFGFRNGRGGVHRCRSGGV